MHRGAQRNHVPYTNAVRAMQRAEPQLGHDGDQQPQEAVGCPINSPVRSNVETWIRR